MCSQILTCFIFLDLFSKKSRFHFKKQPFRKKVLFKEELDYIDIDDIGNIEDSPRLVFIDEECGNLIVVHINQKKKPDVVQSLIGVHSAKNVVGQSIYSVAMWNIYCESGKHGFPCDFFNYRIK